MNKRSICLVSPGNVGSNPRLVKEANALHDAGFKVRVVAGDYMATARHLDQSVLEHARWSWTKVGLGSKINYIKCKLCQKSARTIAATGWIPNLSLAMSAHHTICRKLALAATDQPAELYIAHCLAALPAAAIAANQHNAKLGFDAEDFHIGELADIPENQTEIRIRDRIERTLLSRCSHLTAASPKIAEAYWQRYGIEMEPILNVFPLSEAPKSYERQQGDRIGNEPSLYWFSQTIGAGRGIEAIILAMGKMQTRVRLHLRGIPAAGYQDRLEQLAKEVGVADRLHFLSSAPPVKMIELAACHDIGLSLELNEPLNRAICLTNKLFTYILAGLPVLMSRTPAQEDLALKLNNIAKLIDLQQPKAIARTLDNWLSEPSQITSTRQAAWKLGREVYNWDVEKNRFLTVVEKSLK
jgi:glycosyltransferase involved in cell wall biosynthesis